ncbi:hypothetical protein MNQ98_04930 [Paenibacillus sp. N3/727]|nr:hypothetical protein [Paenibacillus sp. N3/727]UNK19380.1 hypothetical protein MNQ98_04930 [Paenibacillus sp. N3/727]
MIEQTIHFRLKEDTEREIAVRAVQAEVEYGMKLIPSSGKSIANMSI